MCGKTLAFCEKIFSHILFSLKTTPKRLLITRKRYILCINMPPRNEKRKAELRTVSREQGVNPALKVGSYMCGVAVKTLEGTSRIIRKITPGKLAELTLETLPLVDPATFAKLIKRQMKYYSIAPPGETSKSAFERITTAVVEVEMETGDRLTIRRPVLRDLENMGTLYSKGLTAENIESRFFTPLSPARAAQYGIGASSLDLPDSAVDYVAVTDNGNVIGHSGYAMEATDASLHIVIDKEWRHKTASGERLSALMFSRAIATATLDPRVWHINAETLTTNDGVNRLVDTTMNPHGATRRDEGEYFVTRIQKLVETNLDS
jgi:hypothetical protein